MLLVIVIYHMHVRSIGCIKYDFRFGNEIIAQKILNHTLYNL